MIRTAERLTANWMIPAATLLLSLGSDWFSSNFSVIGSGEKRAVFLLWACFVGVFFYRFAGRVLKRIGKSALAWWLLKASALLLAAAVLSPYLPSRFPFLSRLHVASASTASICFMICLLYAALRIKEEGQENGKSFLPSALAIALCSIFIFFIVGIVSSALEVYFTIACAQLVYRMYLKTAAGR